jgi:hypothetical protein
MPLKYFESQALMNDDFHLAVALSIGSYANDRAAPIFMKVFGTLVAFAEDLLHLDQRTG